MKLDYDVLSNALSFIDPVKERCLDLRSLRIPRIENLAITKNLNDTIDLTDNDIAALADFPPLPRLKTLLVANNRIAMISPHVATALPALRNLILSHNALADLADLAPLAEFPLLERVAFAGCPVAAKKDYRMWVIWLCKKVRVVDFRKVKDKVRNRTTHEGLYKADLCNQQEREQAKAMFSGSKEAEAFASETAKKSTFIPGESASANITAAKPAIKPHSGPTPEEAARIKAAINSASSLEEVARLKRQLEGGSLPPEKKAK
ncbi:U2 snRNP complex subunit [Entophlyctis luteolus]|nr:U2 snRNP complex subunit [Entophlyctis luteolus]